MFRITRLRMVTLSMSSLCARNAACVASSVDQPVPSRIAPYSPTNVLPLFGLIELVNRCTPARRQNVVLAGDESTRRWIGWSDAILTAPAGHVMVAWGPTVVSGTALLPAAV
jgi:hypothetical protein